MGRFSNLELEAEPRVELEVTKPAIDERYFLDRADVAYWSGDHEPALKYYTRALELDKRQARGWLGQVMCLVELDEPREAQVWSDKALELLGSEAELLAGKSIAMTRLGDPASGIALSDAALARPGTSALRWRARGEAMLGRDARNAAYCFAKSIAEDARDGRVHLDVGRVCLYHRRPAMAVAHLARGCELLPGSAWCWTNLGLAREALGQTEPALDAYSQALLLDRAQRVASARAAALAHRSVAARLLSWLRSWWR